MVNQQVAVGMLERAGHEATVAENGREVLALLESGAFDVVLMDVQMPEMDGLEATAAIRERERATGGHLPIVALTAHAMKGDAERCLEAGMDAYLAKPLQPRELVAAIDAVVGGDRVRRPRVRQSRGRGPARAPRRPRRRAAARARRGRPEGPGRARPHLPDGLAEAGRAHPGGGPGEATPPRSGPPPTPLKGAVSNFAAPPATEAALRLQKMGDAGRLEGAEAALEQLEREIDALLASLTVVVRRRRRSRAARRRQATAAATPPQSRYFTNTTSLWASL